MLKSFNFSHSDNVIIISSDEAEQTQRGFKQMGHLTSKYVFFIRIVIDLFLKFPCTLERRRRWMTKQFELDLQVGCMSFNSYYLAICPDFHFLFRKMKRVLEDAAIFSDKDDVL